jgi:hypothetical protein
MLFERGVVAQLRKNGQNIESIRLVLGRFEAAVPHLLFDEWSASRGKSVDASHARLTRQEANRMIRIDIHLKSRWTISTTCARAVKVFSQQDHRFIHHLANEAASVLDGDLATTGSVFDFGSYAVASTLKEVFKLKENPVSIFRFLRALAQQTYENQKIAYGVVILPKESGIERFSDAIESKRIQALTDGFSTAIALDRSLQIAGYVSLATPVAEGRTLKRRPWWCGSLAEASKKSGGIGIALLRSGQIVVLHDGKLQYSLRAGGWQYWHHSSILDWMNDSWRGRGMRSSLTPVLKYIYHLALDLSFRRSGALIVVLHNEADLAKILVSRTDALGKKGRPIGEWSLDETLRDIPFHKLDRRIAADLAALDGGVFCSRNGKLLAYGAMSKTAAGTMQGSRTRAAVYASKFGIAIKVSADGNIALMSERFVFIDL